MYITSVGL